MVSRKAETLGNDLLPEIDYILVRKEDKKIIVDCKVIPNESVVVQYKFVVADLRKKLIKKSKSPARNRKIKIWRLKGEKMMYKIVESRKRNRQDVGEVGIIKDENGNILIREEKVKSRWKDYFK